MLLSYMRGAAAPASSLHLLSFAMLLVTIASTACSEISGTNEPSIAGTYDLADVGGKVLPITLYERPFDYAGQRLMVKMQVHHGSLELDGNGYTLLVMKLMTGDGVNIPLPYIDTGTFTKNGAQITFRSDDPETGSFTGSQNTSGAIGIPLDMAGDGHPPTYVFRK